MSGVDDSTVLRVLGESLDRVTALNAGVPARELPGAWSAVQVIEHLVVTEESVFRLMRTLLMRSPEVEPDASRDQAILDRVPDRGGSAQRQQAPDRMQPTGRFTTIEEAVAAFREARGKTVEWARLADEGVLRRHRLPHPALGDLDGVQWLLFLAAHTERHVRQIEGI